MLKFGVEIHLIRYLPFSFQARQFALNDDEWEALCKKVRNNKQIRISFLSKYSYKVCVAGLSRMNIKTDGSVTPCIYVNEVVGNILEEPYDEIERKLKEWRMRYTRKNWLGQVKSLDGCIALREIYDKIY